MVLSRLPYCVFLLVPDSWRCFALASDASFGSRTSQLRSTRHRCVSAWCTHGRRLSCGWSNRSASLSRGGLHTTSLTATRRPRLQKRSWYWKGCCLSAPLRTGCWCSVASVQHFRVAWSVCGKLGNALYLCGVAAKCSWCKVCDHSEQVCEGFFHPRCTWERRTDKYQGHETRSRDS